MAHILPDRELFTWCEHGTPLGHRCNLCAVRPPGAMPPLKPASPGPLPRPKRYAPPGWTCPSCGHSYAPWVPECRHCPEPPAFTAKSEDPGPVEVGQ